MLKKLRAKRSKRLKDNAMREVHKNTPAAVFKTRLKKGPERAEKQRIAIGLAKARKKGARIPKGKS